MISEEILELIGMSDRMLIFKDGEISKELTRSADLKEKDIIEYII
jgi:ribose transport system ATP-binding protein